MSAALPDAVVYVVDDDDSVRRSVQWLLESVHLAVEPFSSAADFLAHYDGSTSACLVLDVRMPRCSGLELQSMLAERGIELPVIIVTGHADVPMAVQAMKAGAFDFVEKPFNDQHLLDRIHAAIDHDRARRRVDGKRRATRARLARLSRREAEVLDHVVRGRSNRDIAAELDLSIKTIESHRARVMAKMEANSLPELIAVVLQAQGKP